MTGKVAQSNKKSSYQVRVRRTTGQVRSYWVEATSEAQARKQVDELLAADPQPKPAVLDVSEVN